MGPVVNLRPVSSPTGTLSDIRLVAAVAAGDADALGTLFERHNRSVYRFLARMAPLDRGCFDDLVQNTFLAAREGAGRFRGKSEVKSWLLAIAANVLKNHIRGEIRRRRAMDRMKSMPCDTAAPSPETTFEAEVAMRHVVRALDDMSHKLKVVFVMCDLEGIPGTEAARCLNLREGTVWRRLHDARHQLRRAIETEQGDRRCREAQRCRGVQR